MRSDETTSPPFDPSSCNNALSAALNLSVLSMSSNVCDAGRELVPFPDCSKIEGLVVHCSLHTLLSYSPRPLVRESPGWMILPGSMSTSRFLIFCR